MTRETLLKNYKLFYFFEELSKIPRGSGDEKAISDHIYEFAKENGLEAYQDEMNNLIIKKPAHSTMADRPGVILQGHLDMVNVKEEDCNHDFDKDPIKLIYTEDLITADGTSLGADNGIAVAMALALLTDKEAVHPKITALFTVDEESGMGGAANLDPTHVEGEIMINIDSEEEGIFLGSCAGGVRNIVTQTVKRTDSKFKETYKVKISNLLGGHSGSEIHTGRANAIKLLGRMLQSFKESFEFELVSLTGGEKMNAIPNRAEAIIRTSHKDKLDELVDSLRNTYSKEYGMVEKNITITTTSEESEMKSMTTESRNYVIALLRLIPYGPQTMSQAIEGLVESSSNIGVLTTEGDAVLFESAIRSSVQTLKHEIAKRIQEAAMLTGADFKLISDYPAWEYREDSHIREVFKSSYKKLFNKDAKIDAIHAGLECGLLTEKLGAIDMISMGPNMYEVHSPNERLEIQSTIRTWELLNDVLKNV
ncbi:MAG: aminoacyl-histidine dipeptidase [Tissierellales bacterium]|jgi:dipeptidase D|nr:aminoacyl-histidine dipeptidase [Tissierellales bacterium]